MKSMFFSRIGILFISLGVLIYSNAIMAVNCRRDTIYNYTFDAAQVKQVTARTIYQYGVKDETLSYTIQNYMAATKTWRNDRKSVYAYTASLQVSEQLASYWDTLKNVWKNNLQFLYLYDLAGNNTLFTYNTWNSTSNQWQGLVRNNSRYDAGNRILEFYNQNWNTTTKTWVNQNKQEHVYDHLGRDTQFSTYTWDKNAGIWVGDKRTTKIYNAIGQNTNTIDRRYLPFYSAWEVNWQTSFTFNAYGLLVKRYVMAYIDNKWKPFQKTLYEYDSAKLCTVENVYTNDTFIGVDTVYLNQKTFYQYDANRRVIEELVQLRNIGLTTFRNSFLTQTTFDAYNQKSEEIISNWSIPLGQWIKYYRNRNTFNSDTNLVLTGQDIANAKQQWVPSYETIHTYNPQGIEVAVDRYSAWDTISQVYTCHTRDEYICKALPPSTGWNTTLVPSLKVFPNPLVTQELTIESIAETTYVLYNHQGQKLKEGLLLQGSNQMHWGQLPNGIYFLKTNNSCTRLVIARE